MPAGSSRAVNRRIVLLGPPASGKGTQAGLIRSTYGLPTASTGLILRRAAAAGTPRGNEIAQKLESGELFPDGLVTGLVKDWIRECSDGFVLDGFPRTVPQAEMLDELLRTSGNSVDAAIYLDTQEKDLIGRVAKRLTCPECGAVFQTGSEVNGPGDPCPDCGAALSQRTDDTAEVFAGRLREFAEKTEPLLPYYDKLNVLHRINGTGSPDEVFARISEVLDDQSRTNHSTRT